MFGSFITRHPPSEVRMYAVVVASNIGRLLILSHEQSAIFLAKSSTGNPGDWSNAGLVFSSKQGDAYNVRSDDLLLG